MKKFITMFIRHLAKSPGKMTLTIAAVALGTGILILSFNASTILQEKAVDQMNKDGIIVYVANGTWASDGTIEQTRPSEWDAKALEYVVSDTSSINSAVPILTPPFNEITTNNETYQLRSAVGTGPNYFSIFSFEIIAGVPMNQDDLDLGQKKVWVSEDMAEYLYGSADEAVGQHIQPPGILMRRGPGENREQNLITQYSIAGVFKTPSEVARRSYGIGDLVFPYTSLVPSGSNVSMMMNFMSGIFVAKGEGSSIEKTTAEIRQAMESNYGEDLDIIVWEGTPHGESSYMEELRQAVSIFTVSVNILGIVLLVTSSLGIFSIMVVESLGRRRDIALERAIGASRGMVVREFWTWSLMLSLIGAVIGAGLAFALSKPVLGTMAPLLGELSADFTEAAEMRVPALITGIALALGCGGVLGLLPAFSAVKGNISETLREV